MKKNPPSRLLVSAPGKLMLAGEYAVTQGGPAIVAAVSRRARVVLSHPGDDGSRPPPGDWRGIDAGMPEALLSRSEAEKAFGSAEGEMTVDVSTLRQQGRKLGLGSSAAVSVAVAGAVAARRGVDLEAERQAIFEAALRGHRAVAPEGSGADVAASAFGGIQRVQREAEQLTHAPLGALPVVPRVVWTGVEARTSDFVARVNACAHRASFFGAIEGATERMIDAMVEPRPEAFLAAARDHYRSLEALGHAAGVGIIEDSLQLVARLAEAAGGAAKPSGAGGGDVAIAFFSSESDAARFDDDCGRAGLALLSLSLGVPGVVLAGPTGLRGHDDA